MGIRARLAAVLTLAWILTPPAMSGTIALSWNPVPGAWGYRVYHGTASGDYQHVTDVGYKTQANLAVDDCVPHFVAVKAYNSAGESQEFSNEVSGMPRPEVDSGELPLLTQGGTYLLNIRGSNFQPGAQLVFDQNDAAGNALITIDSTWVSDCYTMQVLITVEPGTPGFRAMEIGDHTATIRNPDRIVGTVGYEVELEPTRLDINRSDLVTEDRIDGRDLAWLGFAYASTEGHARWNPDADLDGDGAVDGEDLALLAPRFGSCWDGGTWTTSCP